MPTLPLRNYWPRIYSIAMLALMACTSQACQNFGEFWKVGDTRVGGAALPSALNPVLGISAQVDANGSEYAAIATDGAGNMIAVGRRNNTSVVDFGSGVATTLGGHSNYNNLVVKFNSAGVPLWVKSVNAVVNQTRASGVATDSAGNIYVCGVFFGTGSFNFGSGALSSTNNNNNPYLIKYDPNGNVLWTRGLTTGTANNEANAIAVDASGNVYVGGYIGGTGTFDYNGQTVTGVIAGRNMVVVKYDTSGTVMWARGVSTGALTSDIKGLAIDATTGDLIIVGQQTNAGMLTFGSVNVTSVATGNNAVILRLSAAGTYVAGRSVSAASGITRFNAVSVSPSGEIYVCGIQAGNAAVDYGGVTATSAFAGGNNYLVGKYSAALVPQWIRTTAAASDSSECTAIAVTSSDRVVTGGFQSQTGQFDFGGVTATGARAGDNALLVQYASTGQAASASTTTVAPDGSRFNGVALDTTGNVHAAGYQSGNLQFDFGGTVSITAPFAAGNNAIIVNYR